MKRIFHHRNNTGAFKTEKGNFYRFGAKGSPDIIACIGGKYVGIEVKDKSKQSDSQKDFERGLKKAGGDYWIIHSVEELIAKLL